MCAFTGEVDIDMRGKLLIRLRNITELQTQLEACMAGEGGGGGGGEKGGRGEGREGRESGR